MAEQLRLFPEPGEEAGAASAPPADAQTRLTSRSSLSEAIEEFDRAMLLKGFTANTIAAFRADLRILAGYIGASWPIGDIGTRELSDFMTFLVRERRRPCNPKSYARRLTTLKVFFAWLVEVGARASDPAAPLAHQAAPTPLPRVLSEGEIEQLLGAAQSLAAGEDGDPRPLLLVQLLLATGMKKSEVMGIHLAHLDLSDPHAPLAHIRYAQARGRHKERTLRLPAALVPTLRAYRARYKPAEHLFECTARNLEYVLRDLARRAGLAGVSFEELRWTAALRDYRAGMDAEALRKKLGLSKLRWTETQAKLERLAEPAR